TVTTTNQDDVPQYRLFGRSHQSSFLASEDQLAKPLILENPASFSCSAAEGLAICSIEVIPASWSLLAVAGPMPFTRVRSPLSSGLALAGAFLVAGFAAATFLADSAFGVFGALAGLVAAGALVAALGFSSRAALAAC